VACRFTAILAGCALAALGADPLPEGEGKKAVESACAACHSLEIVTDKRWSNEKWRSAVDSMVERGAELNKDQTQTVVQYLTANFGPGKGATARPEAISRGRELVRDICTLCHELDRVKGQQFTKEEWASEIKGMISEGAPVTDEEFSMILEYLAAYFGRPEEGK
jgi:cytochrome c5